MIRYYRGCFRYQQLEFFELLFESGDDGLMSSDRIDLRQIQLGTHGAHVVSSFMMKCNALSSVDLCIHDEWLQIISENLKEKRIQVSFSNSKIFVFNFTH